MVIFGFYEYWLSTKAFDAEGNLLPGDHNEPVIRLGIFANISIGVTYLGTVIHGMVLWSLL